MCNLKSVRIGSVHRPNYYLTSYSEGDVNERKKERRTTIIIYQCVK